MWHACKIEKDGILQEKWSKSLASKKEKDDDAANQASKLR